MTVIDGHIVISKKTYIWSSRTEEWKQAPYLPSRACRGALVPGSGGSSAFWIGGKFNWKLGENSLISSIFKFRCWSANIDDCHWQLLDQHLKTAREDFVALMIPSELVTCDNAPPNLDQCFHEALFTIADGICDDESNTEPCLFDGGDCCRSEIVDFFCVDCICQNDGLKHSIMTTTQQVTQSKLCDTTFFSRTVFFGT